MRFAKRVSFPAILAIPLVGGFVAASWSNAQITQSFEAPAAAQSPAQSPDQTPTQTPQDLVTPASGERASPLDQQQAALPRASALTLPTQDGAEALEEPEAGPTAITRQITVARGDTLMKLLIGAGVEPAHAHKAVTAMEPVFSARRLMPGQEIDLAFAAEQEEGSSEDLGALLAVNFRPSLDRDIQISRLDANEDFSAEVVERPVARQLAFAQGTIQSNLSVAAREVNVPNPVLTEAIRAYSYDVDFQREIQKGDEFEFLYEIFVDEDGAMVRTGELLYATMTLSGSRTELYHYERANGDADFYTPEGASVRRSLMRTPIDGARLSSGFGMRKHPVLGYSKMHKGTDFAAPSGTPIYAAGNGVVEKAGRNGGYGKYVRIRHGSSYKTAYAHLSRYGKGVKAGVRVKQGQIIGYVGTTGRSTGPHLHYEVVLNGKQVNPLKVTLPRGDKLKKNEMADFAARRAEIDRQVAIAMGGILMVQRACEEAEPIEQGSATDNEC
ncbi:M23 family metallopeptidase [Pelagibius litoralis]|uniref:M23 family metallopeptidase n=1 Tax=Pelagibius litoralis TaxID=374515 RepID=A0A967F2M2_9PROT|nr:M23 family metallopeptidase [Pelagibius litoralis]NIA71884.1 M23 family metallopeptidase [Pelagibius litoralis]